MTTIQFTSVFQRRFSWPGFASAVSALGLAAALLAFSEPARSESSTAAPPVATGPVLKVATRSVPPFAYQAADGQWQGIAIDLWERSAEELGFRYEYHDTSLVEMIDGLTDGRFDVAVAALSATAEREKQFDFSHPFYQTGLGIAIQQNEDWSWFAFFKAMASPAFIGAVGALLALLTIIGALVWLLERKRNDQFPADPLHGIGAGLWWSSVTMTTVGYGDKSPITPGGRVIGLIWMFASIIIISTVTAGLTTALTLDGLSARIKSEDDLVSVRAATVSDSTSAARLATRGIGFKGFADLDMAMSALAIGEVDAVVYDQPLLQYLVRTHFPGVLTVLGQTVESQVYAIGLPNNSPIRESLNQQVLANTHGPFWSGVLQRHLGLRAD